jgi:hypothetical protein
VIGVSPPSRTPSPLTSRKICDAHSPLLSAVESVIVPTGSDTLPLLVIVWA